MSAKNELDQYYTSPPYAEDCFDAVWTYHKGGHFIEPCAGRGAFFDLMPLNNRTGIDLDPKCKGVLKRDWLTYVSDDICGATVVTNPPFGRNAQLAVRFFNRCDGAAVIAMVVPRTFRKASIINKLARNYRLVHDVTTPKNSFILNGTPYDVPCCFQVWVYSDNERPIIDTSTEHDLFSWCDQSSADFAIRRVGGRAGQLLDGLDHSPTSTYFVSATGSTSVLYGALKDMNLSDVRDNTAGVRSVAKHEIVKAINEVLICNLSK